MRGRLFHNMIVNEAKAVLDGFFEQVRPEHPVRRDGVTTFLDLFACGPMCPLAIEVETTDRHAFDNARKAAAVDVPLWIVVPTRAMQSRLVQRLGLLGLTPGGEPICVLLLGQLPQALARYLPSRIDTTENNKQITNLKSGQARGELSCESAGKM